MKDLTTTTIYEEKLVKKFLKDFYFDKVKYLRIVINILIAVIVIYFFTKDERNTLDIITFVFAIFGIIEVNSTLLPNINYCRLKKKKDNVLNSKIKYTFKENNFRIFIDEAENIDYKDLKKVVEVDNAYYLYINSSRAFIVDKEKLNDEEINYLTNLLKEKVSTYKYDK